jgi:hypothetical protein
VAKFAAILRASGSGGGVTGGTARWGSCNNLVSAGRFPSRVGVVKSGKGRQVLRLQAPFARSAKYSDAGVTPVSNKCSRARVQAT